MRSPMLGGFRVFIMIRVSNSTADDEFFHRVTSNSTHVLHPYLPVKSDIPYELRTRPHCMTLISKTKFLNVTDFIIRLLYKYSY